MKQVVGVSLGTPNRDYQTQCVLLGESVTVARRGTNGDLGRAREWIRASDGTVDAIGLGGIDRWIVLDGVRYEIADAAGLVNAAQITPVVDGSGIKATWERDVIFRLTEREVIRPDDRVLMVSALDRFGMAEAFWELGYGLVAGDLVFAAGLDVPIESREDLIKIGKRLLPEFVRRPFQELYPIGEAQTQAPDVRYRRYFDQARVIAGDFHLIRRFLPPELAGKIMITNTTTAEDVKMLHARGLARLITTTPRWGPRSFGSNLLEAAIVAVTGVQADAREWAETVRRLGLAYGDLEF